MFKIVPARLSAKVLATTVTTVVTGAVVASKLCKEDDPKKREADIERARNLTTREVNQRILSILTRY